MERKMILCVDDDATVLTTRQLVLQAAGFGVVTATDGSAGLTLFEDERVHAVVLDYLMPGMNGGEVAAEMKKRRPGVPILMLSAHMFPPDSALRNVDAFVTKGEGPEAMLTALGRLLHGPAKDSA